MIDASAGSLPPFHAFVNPILAFLRRRAVSVTIEEMDAGVLGEMKLAPTLASLPHKADRPEKSEASYRIAWARTYLKKAGLIDNPERGIWCITAAGAATETVDEREIAARFRAEYRETEPDGEDEDVPTEALTLGDATIVSRLADDLRRTHDELAASGDLPREEDIAGPYRIFRERFGPDVLRGLDGEQLLQAMHARRTKDSLVYWLEFKDDEELPASFGSIAGGSALKFGMYQRAETGDWWTGTSKAQTRMTVEEAVAKARSQRDQLLAGIAVLSEAAQSREIDYSALQVRMVEASPDVAETAWGHKYFALLFPAVLDDFHVVDYQRYQIIKLLKVPTMGRYSNAHYLAGAARQLGIHVSNLASVLNRRNGSPHNYWRIGTTANGVSDWARMRDGHFVGIGWTELGDLSDLEQTKESKDQLRARFAEKWPGDAGTITRNAKEIHDFVARARERDVVVAMDGVTVRGIGAIAGPYSHREQDGPFGHRRPVRWLSFAEGRLLHTEQPRTTFRPLGKWADNLVEIERRILEGSALATINGAENTPSPAPPVKDSIAQSTAPLPALEVVVARVETALRRKGQVILYGPPGTGKTYWGDRAMNELAARKWFQKSYASLTQEEKGTLRSERAIQTCTFHPSYGYEDFVEGYRPDHANEQLTFRRRDGIFKELCTRARSNRSRPYFLLIDEINRGDVPRILGELLTIIEKDKRDKEVVLPVSGETFAVPENVFVIGTMNMADRSIALLDAALRRRFAFIELLPDASFLAGALVDGLPLGPWLEELNKRVLLFAGRDARHLQIGHAYLMSGPNALRDVARFAEVLRDDIIPLLEEYCYENYEALADILGDHVVLRGAKRIRESLFEQDHHDELIAALLKAFSTITATAAAVDAEAAEEADVEGDDTDDVSGEVVDIEKS